MTTIIVEVEWGGSNYAATLHDSQVPGAVMATHKTLDGVKQAFAAALDTHLAGMAADGDTLPSWLAARDYTLTFHLQTSAQLHSSTQYTTLAAIAHVSGINPRLLSHYANGGKKPRPQQQQRITAALHTIAQAVLALG